MRFRSELMDNCWRAAVSYITGAHALKIGYQDHVGRMHNFFNVPVAGNLSYTFNAGSPVQITQRVALRGPRPTCTTAASTRRIAGRWGG